MVLQVTCNNKVKIYSVNLPMSLRDKHILVVDDEPLLVRLNKRQLENKGYNVSVSTESRDALEQFQNNPDKFDLLLTDLTMPGISGKDLISQILMVSPGLPVIVLTGMADEETEDELRQLGVSAVVVKPVIEGELLSAVERILGEE